MKTLSIDVRRAEPQDAAAISEAHRASWLHAYAGIIPHKPLMQMVQRRDAAWWRKATRGPATLLVLDVAGVIAGYATLGLNRARALPQDGEIYEIYLRPEYQGLGLGSRLFAAARARLADNGLKGLVVSALEENQNALSFYAGAGGRDIAEGVEVFEQKALKKVAFVWE